MITNDFFYELAEQEIEKKQYENALNYMQKYLENQNHGIDDNGLIILARSIKHAKKDLKEARKIYLICLKLNPNNITAKFKLGKIYSKEGKLQEAELLFKECIEKNQKKIYGLFELGKLYAKQNKLLEATKLFKECIELDPNNVYARLELGKLYIKQKNTTKAECLFKEYMEIDPNNIFARFELGKLYVKQNKLLEGKKFFKECIELDSNNIFARLELGKLYVIQGEYLEAETLFKEYLELSPNSIFARFELGKLYVKKGKYLEAEVLFKEYLELSPNNIFAGFELGKLYVKQGRLSEAEELFKGCINNSSNNVYAMLELGKLYAAQGKNSKAEKLFEEIILIDPNRIGAKKGLMMIYEKKGHGYEKEILKEEIDVLQQKSNSKETIILNILKRIYSSNDKEEISSLCNEVLKLDPKNFEALMLKSSLCTEESKKQDKKDSINYEILLRKDGLIDGLSCEVAKYFEGLNKEELKNIKKTLTILLDKCKEPVTMETNNYSWYLKFKCQNVTILERLYKINNNGIYQSIPSATLVIPNNVEIKNGVIANENIMKIRRVIHKETYEKKLEEAISSATEEYLASIDVKIKTHVKK